jgi:hypothetical protein
MTHSGRSCPLRQDVWLEALASPIETIMAADTISRSI